MQISTKGKYTVRALLDLAHHYDGSPVPLGAISRREGISLLFLEQLFHQLRKASVVNSVRGPYGGFVLARDPSDITIGEIVRLVEAPVYTSSCFDKSEPVDDCRIGETCVSGALWRQLAEHIGSFLDSITLADLCKSKVEVVYDLRMKSNRILAARAGSAKENLETEEATRPA